MNDLEWLILVAIVLAAALFFLRYGKALWRLWKEPALRYPVLIFESDDWGPAEDFEAGRLRQIAKVLSAYQDSAGRHPVMTLGIVLTVPDSSRMSATVFSRYYALRLDDERFASIRDAMSDGMREGVFALQLHGMAHYFPKTLMLAAKDKPEVKSWLMQAGIADPWDLPSALQSRWTDGASLPSKELSPTVAEKEAADEAVAFREIFGVTPDVAVPPTFIWPPEVERGWARQGVRYVVTPGRRFDGRDGAGKPSARGETILNGQKGEAGSVTYLVRDDYFEPSLGHRASDVVRGLSLKTALGRPALFETHRFNFNGTEEECQNSLEELDKALRLILQNYPETRFLTSSELGKIILEKRSGWIEQRFLIRIRYLQRRARIVLPVIRRIFPLFG